MAKCLNSSSWALCMIAFASSSCSTDIRCSYQSIAWASSISERHMRAKVRVSWDSSDAGSWYWSNPVVLLSRSDFHDSAYPATLAKKQ